ncbi:MAG: phage holin family protein [Hymenobacteraceae bacterium]|nr:phage holin family protein [Hymenobacteraceae bacterium]MDX5396503.1 phage holin family protein [Hymenobacteraceae bacterium]MDX5512570.1 phage holin family protein [Hymenobacteraceae bacterium]
MSTEKEVSDNNRASKMDNLIENLTGYIDTRIDLIKLEIQNKLKAALVSTMHFAMLAFFGIMFFLFLNLFLALLLNHLLDSTFWGFGIVTLFYLILFIVFVIGLDKKVFQSMADKALDNTIYKPDKHNETV